jgi:hypothetical protein
MVPENRLPLAASESGEQPFGLLLKRPSLVSVLGLVVVAALSCSNRKEKSYEKSQVGHSKESCEASTIHCSWKNEQSQGRARCAARTRANSAYEGERAGALEEQASVHDRLTEAAQGGKY